MLLQTFHEPPAWREGAPLEPADVVDKEDAHERGLLHLSSHLLVMDARGRVLARKRSDDDLRYGGCWTSTLGTHVAHGATYESTLRALVPQEVALEWVGEFRVRDAHENEVCGLFVARADAAPGAWVVDRRFLTARELIDAAREGRATPHLVAAVERHARAARLREDPPGGA